MDRMVFPRLAAYAEVGWTKSTRKDYKVFRNNLDFILERWKKEGVGYADNFEMKDFKKKK